MKNKNLRELDLDELYKRELELREELFKLKFQHGIRQLENPARLKHIKKDIARVKTIVNQRARA